MQIKILYCEVYLPLHILKIKQHVRKSCYEKLLVGAGGWNVHFMSCGPHDDSCKNETEKLHSSWDSLARLINLDDLLTQLSRLIWMTNRHSLAGKTIPDWTGKSNLICIWQHICFSWHSFLHLAGAWCSRGHIEHWKHAIAQINFFQNKTLSYTISHSLVSKSQCKMECYATH